MFLRETQKKKILHVLMVVELGSVLNSNNCTDYPRHILKKLNLLK